MAVMKISLDDSHFHGGSKNNSEKKVSNSESTFVFQKRVPQITRKKKKFPTKLVVILGLVALVLGLLRVGAGLLQTISPSTAGLKTFIPVLKPELKKDSEGKTNVLLVGIDTRESGQVELNTDTIILASYDHETHRLAMLSFPRDLAVQFPGRSDFTRINSMYAIGERQKKGTGLGKLVEVVSGLSGRDIHYYAMVDLKGFIDAIDVVGGISIYLEYDISGLYPTETYGYKKVSFKRGWNEMNGEQALQYSRIRKGVTPKSEESDFARSRRQQEVIQAVIDKAVKNETLLNPTRVMELLGVASKNLTVSEFRLEDVQAGVGILKDKGKPVSYSYVIDLYAGGSVGKLISVINFNPYLLGPVQGYGKWAELKKFIALYFTEPSLATMKKTVSVYAGDTASANLAKAFQSKYYYAPITVTTNQKVFGETIPHGRVYAIGGRAYEVTAKFVAKELGLQFETEIPEEVKKLFDVKEYGVVAVY